jgi:hypothetical protein
VPRYRVDFNHNNRVFKPLPEVTDISKPVLEDEAFDEQACVVSLLDLTMTVIEEVDHLFYFGETMTSTSRQSLDESRVTRELTLCKALPENETEYTAKKNGADLPWYTVPTT